MHPCLRNALATLVHPATIAAVALLALNDHVLRRLWPSALTGKLGDFAWLFFMPLATGALLSLLDRRRTPARQEWLYRFSFLTVGGVFALAKTLPAAHSAVVDVASRLFGFPVAWRLDPTDLVALPALAPAWMTWRAAKRRAQLTPGDAGRRPSRRGWLVVPLAALLTVANAGAPRPDPGVDCLAVTEGRLTVRTFDGVYVSENGGMRWEKTDQAYEDFASPLATPEPRTQATWSSPPVALEAGASPEPAATGDFTSPVTDTADGAGVEAVPADDWEPWLEETHECRRNPVADPNDPDVQYRYVADEVIEMSKDGGATWQTVFEVPPLTEDEQAAYERRHSSGPYFGSNTQAVFRPRPLDALVDPATGNALFAMGHQGVLVRQTDGTWHWVRVGSYGRE